MAEPMSQRHWLAVKRYVADIRATYRDLRYAGRPMQHLVPLFDEAERLKGEVEQWRATFGETALRDGLARMARVEAERGRYRLAYESARRGRRTARRFAAELVTSYTATLRTVQEERDRARTERDDARHDRSALSEQVRRVRELHAPVTNLPDLPPGVVVCRHCLTYDGQTVPAPCPTIRALDGTEAGR
jgi:hypothetical protein